MENPENCRLCSQSTDVFNLFALTPTIKSKISQTFKINLKDDQSLPQSICHDCNEKLDESFKFFKHICQVQDTLKGCEDEGNNFEVNSVEIKTEHYDESIVKVQFDMEDQIVMEMMKNFETVDQKLLTECFVKIEKFEVENYSPRKRNYQEDFSSLQAPAAKKAKKNGPKIPKPSKIRPKSLIDQPSRNSKTLAESLITKVIKNPPRPSKEIGEKLKAEKQAQILARKEEIQLKKTERLKKSLLNPKKLASRIKRPRNYIGPPLDPAKFIRMKKIYKEELKGKFSSNCLTLDVNEDEKLEDGRVTKEAALRFENVKWSNYEWKCTECQGDF